MVPYHFLKLIKYALIEIRLWCNPAVVRCVSLPIVFNGIGVDMFRERSKIPEGTGRSLEMYISKHLGPRVTLTEYMNQCVYQIMAISQYIKQKQDAMNDEFIDEYAISHTVGSYIVSLFQYACIAAIRRVRFMKELL